MNYKPALAILILTISVISCSRKATPIKPEEAVVIVKNEDATVKNEEVVVRKPAPVVKTATPKSIVVNDKAATKTVNGRYYYDLEGKRYWRNKRDGKYYLYYKGMFENKDFQ